MVDLSLRQTEKRYHDLKRSQFIVYSNQLKEEVKKGDERGQNIKRLKEDMVHQSLLQHLKHRLAVKEKWNGNLQTKLNQRISPNLMVRKRRDLMWSMRTQYDALPNS